MATTPITALTADTAPTPDDLLVTVTDPAGTPATRKVTLSAAVAGAGVIVEDETGTSYTIDAADTGRVKRFTNAGLVTVTLPHGIAVGTVVSLLAWGAAGITVQDNGTSVVQEEGAVAQYDTATCVVVATNTWLVAAGNSLVISDEGSPLASIAASLDFVGAGVTASGTGAAKTITIPGGSGQAPWFLSPDHGIVPFDAVGLSVGTSNHAWYAPATLQAGATITGVSLNVNTQSGNICVGLYDSAGERVATSGSVACPAVGISTVSFTAGYVASAGRYYLAIAADNTTAKFLAVGNGIASGAPPYFARFQASAFPLPTTATFTNTGLRHFALVGVISGGYP